MNKEDEKKKIDISEGVSKLFEGSEMSAALKEQTVALFEVAVAEKTSENVEILKEEISTAIDSMVSDIVEENCNNIDKYLSYVCEEWLEENKIAVENTIKVQVAEEFFDGLRSLFKEHNVNLSEDESKVADSLAVKVAELENKLNEEIEAKIELTKTINEAKIKDVFVEMSEGLADSEIERLAELMETFNGLSVEDYTAKLKIVKESYFPVNKANKADLTEDTGAGDGDEEKDAKTDNPQMSIYTSYLSGAFA